MKGRTEAEDSLTSQDLYINVVFIEREDKEGLYTHI